MTREDILLAAANIFMQKGYHATSMQDIAAAVNLQKASLYHHFRGKQEILLALLDMGVDLLAERLDQIVLLPYSPDEKLRQAIISYFEILAQYQSISAVLLLEHRSLDDDTKLKHVPHRDRIEQQLKRLIQEGVDKNLFSYHNPSIAVKALLGELNWTVVWYKCDGSLSASEIAEEFANLFLEGLKNRKVVN